MELNTSQTSCPPGPATKSIGPPVLDPDPLHEQEDDPVILSLGPPPILEPDPGGTTPLTTTNTSSRYPR